MQASEQYPLPQAQQTFSSSRMNSLSQNNSFTNFQADHHTIATSTNKEEKSLSTNAFLVSAGAAIVAGAGTTTKKKKRTDMLRYNGSAFPSDFFKDSSQKHTTTDTQAQPPLESTNSLNPLNYTVTSTTTPTLPIESYESPKKKSTNHSTTTNYNNNQTTNSLAKSASPNEFLLYSNHQIPQLSSNTCTCNLKSCPLCACRHYDSHVKNDPFATEVLPGAARLAPQQSEQSNLIELAIASQAGTSIPTGTSKKLPQQQLEQINPSDSHLPQQQLKNQQELDAKASKERVPAVAQNGTNRRKIEQVLDAKNTKERRGNEMCDNYGFPSETPKFNEQQRMVAGSSETDQSPQKSDYRLNPSKITQNRCSFSFTFAEKLSPSTTHPSHSYSHSHAALPAPSSSSSHSAFQSQIQHQQPLHSQFPHQQSQQQQQQQQQPLSQHHDDLDTTFMISEASTQEEPNSSGSSSSQSARNTTSSTAAPQKVQLLHVKQDSVNQQNNKHPPTKPILHIPKQSTKHANNKSLITTAAALASVTTTTGTLQVNRSSPSLIGRNTLHAEHKLTTAASSSSSMLFEQKENVRFIQANEVDDFAQSTSQIEKYQIANAAANATAGLFRIGSISKFDLIPLLRGQQAKPDSNKSDHTADFNQHNTSIQPQPTSAPAATAAGVQNPPLPSLRQTVTSSSNTLEASSSIRQHLQFYRQRSEKKKQSNETPSTRIPSASTSSAKTTSELALDPKEPKQLIISEFKLSQQNQPLHFSDSDKNKLISQLKSWSSQPYQLVIPPQSNNAASSVETCLTSAASAAAETFFNSNEFDQFTRLRKFIASEKGDRNNNNITADRSESDQKKRSYSSMNSQRYHYQQVYNKSKQTTHQKGNSFCQPAVFSAAAAIGQDSFCNVSDSFIQVECSFGAGQHSSSFGHGLNLSNAAASQAGLAYAHFTTNSNGNSTFARRGISAGTSLKNLHSEEQQAEIIIPISTIAAPASQRGSNLQDKDIILKQAALSARRMQKVKSLPKIRSASKLDSKQQQQQPVIETTTVLTSTESPQVNNNNNNNNNNIPQQQQLQQTNDNKRIRLVKIYRIPSSSQNLDGDQQQQQLHHHNQRDGIQSIRSARELTSQHSRQSNNNNNIGIAGLRDIHNTISSARGNTSDNHKREIIEEQQSKHTGGSLSTQNSDKTLFRERSLTATKNSQNSQIHHRPNSKEQLNRQILTEPNNEETKIPATISSSNKITRISSAQKPQNFSQMPSILAKISFQKKPTAQPLKLSSKDANEPCDLLRQRTNIK